ncbi:hypothetical protein MKUB_46010 [Mycobacterium kubicae]|uniref:Uncharacterized protein n=1 Tax=Mycobacterium kubicae TaxID=120959 RepID=A0ABQ1BTU8_9MYCO|nr:hypothetical protein MKUB_46010 [Mycobacterium kubicae]
MCLSGADQGIQPGRAELHSLEVVLVVQEFRAYIGQRYVIGWIVRDFPYISGPGGVEYQVVSR